MCHSATIYANAIMHAGTTVDTFLRENLVQHRTAYITFSFNDADGIYVNRLTQTCMCICYDCLLLILVNCQDWLSRATNWAKFSATAGLGVIHRGHLQQGRSLMAPYLPQGGGGGGGSPYSEGGALYALGLIHANHGEGIKQFLRDSLRSTNVEVLTFYLLILWHF